MSEVTHERESLWQFYSAGIAAYNGDRDAWGQSMQRVLAADTGNPYYRWVIGGEGRDSGLKNETEPTR